MGFLYFIGLPTMAYKKKAAEFTVRTVQFKSNPLLNRKQFVVVVHHKNWNGTVPKTKLGGGESRGFGLIYDDVASMKRYEPNYRLQRIGMGRKRMVARKSQKERKNRAAKDRGALKGKGGKKK